MKMKCFGVAKSAKSILFSCLLMVVAGTARSQVESIGDERTISRDRGEPTKEITVICESDKAERTLVKKGFQASWCDSKIPDICHSRKARVAKEVCELFYAFRLSQLEGAQATGQSSNSDSQKAAEQAELKRELLQIESQRLKLADRTLELKRREFELLQKKEEQELK